MKQTISLKRPHGLIERLRLRWIYMRSFPPQECKPFSMIVKTAKTGRGDLWAIKRGGIILGLVATINGKDNVLLDYFAISKQHRGGGIGSAVFQRIVETYRGRGLILEIENPNVPSDNQQQRCRRKEFYLRCGAKPLGVYVTLFGVRMELLGVDCALSYDEYVDFYRTNYSQWAADHISEDFDV